MLSQEQQKHVSKTNHSPEIEVNCVVYNSIPVVSGCCFALYLGINGYEINETHTIICMMDINMREVLSHTCQSK